METLYCTAVAESTSNSNTVDDGDDVKNRNFFIKYATDESWRIYVTMRRQCRSPATGGFSGIQKLEPKEKSQQQQQKKQQIFTTKIDPDSSNFDDQQQHQEEIQQQESRDTFSHWWWSRNNNKNHNNNDDVVDPNRNKKKYFFEDLYDDIMPSFAFAETMKYALLGQSISLTANEDHHHQHHDDKNANEVIEERGGVAPLLKPDGKGKFISGSFLFEEVAFGAPIGSGWVFNTEGHPFRIV